MYRDEWIENNYPNVMFVTDKNGEVMALLGINEQGESTI